MFKSKKYICAILGLLALGCSLVCAVEIEEGTLKKPGRNKVVLVGKVSLKNPIDYAAREPAFKAMKIDWLFPPKNRDFYYTVKGFDFENNPDFGQTFFAEAKVQKDGTVRIEEFMAWIFGHTNDNFWFRLPAMVDITVPEGAQYVYVGNFQYDLDYALRSIDLQHLDEFSSAQEELNRALGEKGDLYRGELKFLTPEDLKEK